jgi:hypothetical protein
MIFCADIIGFRTNAANYEATCNDLDLQPKDFIECDFWFNNDLNLESYLQLGSEEGKNLHQCGGVFISVLPYNLLPLKTVSRNDDIREAYWLIRDKCNWAGGVYANAREYSMAKRYDTGSEAVYGNGHLIVHISDHWVIV